jgi:hypothetical protein
MSYNNSYRSLIKLINDNSHGITPEDQAFEDAAITQTLARNPLNYTYNSDYNGEGGFF